jgi:hypothetical protein
MYQGTTSVVPQVLERLALERVTRNWKPEAETRN